MYTWCTNVCSYLKYISLILKEIILNKSSPYSCQLILPHTDHLMSYCSLIFGSAQLFYSYSVQHLRRTFLKTNFSTQTIFHVDVVSSSRKPKMKNITGGIVEFRCGTSNGGNDYRSYFRNYTRFAHWDC